MKKSQFHLFVAVILFPVSVIFAQPNNPNPTFRLTNWGDTQAFVKEVEKARILIDYPGLLVYQDSLFGFDMMVKYFFDEDSLFRANYVILEEKEDVNEVVADYKEVRKVAVSMLGEAVYELIPRKAKEFAYWIEQGRDIYSSWELPRSDVRSRLTKDENSNYFIEVEVTSK